MSRLLSCARCSARIRHDVTRTATCKGQGIFYSAALTRAPRGRTCVFVVSFFCFPWHVLWLRPSTGDTLCLLPRRGADRDLLHADRDFSLALAVLHAFEMPSLALQHQKARGALGLSSADRLLAACTAFWVVFFSLWFLRGHLRHLECWCLLPSSQRLTGCNYGHAFSRLLSCTCGSAHIRHGVARAATCKGQGVFHSAALKDCLVVDMASSLFLCCFFGGFL